MSWNPDDLSGFSLPGYRLIRQLGQGGMATVYLAVQESVDREVALKVMSPFLASDRSFTERFLREARIAAQLHHPRIVTVHDVGVHDTYHFIAMQYLSGGKLSDIDLSGLEVARALQIVQDIAEALAYAHDKGYVHRDVKPDNILFDEKGASCLTDFGIARAADSNTQMTATGSIIGTPHYMSPEQARGRKVDHRADLYSLGIVLYELLVGEVPYQSEESLTVCIMHVNDPLPRLPQCLAPLQPVLDRLLAKDPADRYAQAGEFLQALQQLQASGELESCLHYTPATLPHVVENTTRKNTPEIVPTPRPETRRNVEKPVGPRRKKLWKALLAVVGVLALVAVAVQLRERWLEQQEQVREEVRLSQQLTRLHWLAEQGRFIRPLEDNASTLLQQLLNAHPRQPRVQAAARTVMERWLEVLEQNPDPQALQAWQALAEQLPLDATDLTLRAASLQQAAGKPPVVREGADDSSGEQSAGSDWQAVVEALLQSEDFNDLLRAWSLLQQPPPEVPLEWQEALRQQAVDRLRQQLQQMLDANDTRTMALRLARLETLPVLYQRLDGAWWQKQLREQQAQEDDDQLLAERIRQLLDEGQNFLAHTQLTRPAGANAQERFEQVLALDPENEAAKKGLQQVLETLLQLAERAMDDQDLARASRYLESARGLALESPALLAVEQRLQQLRAQVKNHRPGKEKKPPVSLPEDETALLAYAEQHKRRQPVEAIRAWRKVLQINPSNLQVEESLARMAQALALDVEFLLEQQAFEQAEERLQWAMMADPDHPDVKAVRRKFKRLARQRALPDKSVEVSQLKTTALAQRLLSQASKAVQLSELKDVQANLVRAGIGVEMKRQIQQAMLQRAVDRIDQLLQAGDTARAGLWLDWLEAQPGGTEQAASLRLRWRARQVKSDPGL